MSGSELVPLKSPILPNKLAILSISHSFSNLRQLKFQCTPHFIRSPSVRTLRAGKLNEKILKLFIATGKEEILSLIGAFNIQCVLTPVLPTRCSEKF
uniref:Uncharacterized protein n=1 Tax=Solanum tuberosum TaxID=4113 RepID=M1C4C0_SOLTU